MQRFKLGMHIVDGEPKTCVLLDPTGPYVLHEAALTEIEEARRAEADFQTQALVRADEDGYRRGYKQAIATLDAERAAREAVPG